MESNITKILIHDPPLRGKMGKIQNYMFFYKKLKKKSFQPIFPPNLAKKEESVNF